MFLINKNVYILISSCPRKIIIKLATKIQNIGWYNYNIVFVVHIIIYLSPCRLKPIILWNTYYTNNIHNIIMFNFVILPRNNILKFVFCIYFIILAQYYLYTQYIPILCNVCVLPLLKIYNYFFNFVISLCNTIHICNRK